MAGRGDEDRTSTRAGRPYRWVSTWVGVHTREVRNELRGVRNDLKGVGKTKGHDGPRPVLR